MTNALAALDFNLFSDFTVKKVNLKKQMQYDRIDTNGEVISVAIDPNEEVRPVCSLQSFLIG